MSNTEPSGSTSHGTRARPPSTVVVIGAGMSGLVAARELSASGVSVTVVDKGRTVGGRLATRRIGRARLDHGAQFFTVRTPTFERCVNDWIERGVAREWTRGFAKGFTNDMRNSPPRPSVTPVDDGFPRYMAPGGMTSLAKDLAAGLGVETSTMVFTIRLAPVDADHRWQVVIDDGTVRGADAVIVTTPLPQAFSLLVDLVWAEDGDRPDASDHRIELAERLFRTEYDRTIGLLATLDRPSAVPAPGGIQGSDGIFSFIGDNMIKGVSDIPAVTFHADVNWSEERWDDHADVLLTEMINAAQPWLGDSQILEAQIKKWRFATPRTIWPDPCFVTSDGTMVFAGDAFAGPRVEGAYNSGLAAARALLG